MQQARRRNIGSSVDEPNAFRITYAPHSFEATTNQRNGPIFSSEYSATPSNTFSRHTPDHNHHQNHPLEPASWLMAPDLSSATFSAHDFLQHVLSQRFDRTALSNHNPILENSFDADAALAALDTVESALRKKREIARRDEEVARNELRKALHMSAKKREQLMRSADSMASNLSTFADVGRQASQELGSDVLNLHAATERLTSLLDACDIVSLLAVENCELDAVRVSRLLSKAYRHIDDGSLAEVLGADDMTDACEEMGRCRHELALSIDVWMKNAVDSGQVDVVRECAQAAEALDISDTFIESYLSHVLALDQEPRRPIARMGKLPLKPTEELERFRVTCWETTNAIGEVLPTLREAFRNPARPLASVVRIISEQKVVLAADGLISKLLTQVQASPKQVVEDRTLSELGLATFGVPSQKRLRNVALSDVSGNWQKDTNSISEERKRLLCACSEVFTAMSKVKSELLTQCGSVPGAERVEAEFTTGRDPYVDFAERWIPDYLKQEKMWMEEEFGRAFFDVTRIETHSPRLAPREASDAGVYHRFRAFYGHISSQFHHMTRKAVETTYEALSRVATALVSTTGGSTEGAFGLEEQYLSESQSNRTLKSVVFEHLFEGSSRGFSLTADLDTNEYDTKTDYLRRDDRNPECHMDTRPGVTRTARVLRDMLNALVMSYLANAETILQAATHLLPISSEMAMKQDLWVSGAAPLTAYMQAVDILSRSNETVSEFLVTLELTDQIHDACSPISNSDCDLNVLVPQETREVLHRELTCGLSDLGVEAQVGVRAAISSVRARLFAILVNPATRRLYSGEKEPTQSSSSSSLRDDNGIDKLGLDIDPSRAFMAASTFMEQQLIAVSSNVHGGNREFVISELCRIAKEAVLTCWRSCEGPLSLMGALQLAADGRAMLQVFHKFRDCAATLECLPAIGHLFSESADELWKCVESRALASVDAGILVEMLRKREDHDSERIVKVCQSLGAAD